MHIKNQAKVLIADDDHLVREAVAKILQMFGHQVVAVASGRETIETLNTDKDFDVIVLDINMPNLDGFETISEINRRKLDIPVLFLTGAGSMDYAIKAISLGAYDFINKPIEDLDLFNVKIMRAVEKRMYVVKEKTYKASLEKEVLAKTKELAEKNQLLEEYSHNLEISAINALTSLQVALEEKDAYTAGHTTRVTEYAIIIAQALNLPDDEIIILERACQVHDIGKLVIDINYIQKPGPLSKDEWKRMRKHPAVGANIIKPLPFLAQEREIVLHHHERLDGKGYPDGIGGNEISILTRIITVADSYDAMTSRRSYKQNMTCEQAVAELRRCAGTQFDPDVVETFANVFINNFAGENYGQLQRIGIQGPK